MSIYGHIGAIKGAEALGEKARAAEMRWSRDEDRAAQQQAKAEDAQNRYWTNVLNGIREDVEAENRAIAKRKADAIKRLSTASAAAKAARDKASKAGVKDAAGAKKKIEGRIGNLTVPKSSPLKKILTTVRDSDVDIKQAWDPFRVTQQYVDPTGRARFPKFVEFDDGASIVLDQFIQTQLGLPDGLNTDSGKIYSQMAELLGEDQARRMKILVEGPGAGQEKWRADRKELATLEQELAEYDQKLKDAGLTPAETKAITAQSAARVEYTDAIGTDSFDVMSETIRRKDELAGILDASGINNPFSPKETVDQAVAGTLPRGMLQPQAQTAVDQLAGQLTSLKTDAGFLRWAQERGISVEGASVPYSVAMRYANEAAGRGRLGWREAKGRRAQLRGTGAVYTVEARDTKTYDIGLRDPAGLPLFAFNEAGEFVQPERIAEQIDAQLAGSRVVVADLDDKADRTRIEGLLAAEGDTGALVGAIQVAYGGDKPTSGAQLFYDKETGEVALVDGRGKVLRKHTLDQANAVLLQDSAVDAKQNLFQPAGTADAVQSGGRGGNNLADLSGFAEGEVAAIGEYYPPGLGLTTTVPVKIFTSERTQYRAGMDPDIVVFMDVDPVTGEKVRREVHVSDTLSVQRLSPEDQLTSFIEAGMRPGQARRRVRRNERKRRKYARREGTLAEGIVRARTPGGAETTTFERDVAEPVEPEALAVEPAEAPVVEPTAEPPDAKPVEPAEGRGAGTGKGKGKGKGGAPPPSAPRGVVREPIVAPVFGSPVGAGESTGTPESEAQRRARTIMTTGQVMTGDEQGGSGDTDMSAAALKRRKKAREEGLALGEEYGARYTGTKRQGLSLYTPRPSVGLNRPEYAGGLGVDPSRPEYESKESEQVRALKEERERRKKAEAEAERKRMAEG